MKKLTAVFLILVLLITGLSIPAFGLAEKESAAKDAAFSAKATPGTAEAEPGETVKFTAKASGAKGKLKYQWQYSTNKGTTWKNSAQDGNRKKTLSVEVNEKRLNYWYRCEVTDSELGTVYTNAVKIRRPEAKSEAKDETKTETKDEAKENKSKFSVSIKKLNTGVAYGKKVQLLATVKFAVGSVKYTWQYSDNNGKTWKNATKLSGKSPKLTVKEANLARLYRCVAKDNKTKATSKAIRVMDFTFPETKPTYRALLIGERAFGSDKPDVIEYVMYQYGLSYEEASEWYDERYCARNGGDVVHMKNLLSRVYGPAGTKYKVTAKYDLTYNGIKNAIKSTFAKTKSTDVSIFMISSHGAVSYSDGTLIDGTQAGAIATMDDDVTFEELAYWLKTYVKGKVIVLIETCGAGSSIYDPDVPENGKRLANAADDRMVQKAISAFANADCDVTVPTTEETENGAGEMIVNTGELRSKKFYVLAAARHQELSWSEYETYDSRTQDQAGNVFINGLISGVGDASYSPADQNPKNKVVTLEECFNYICAYVQYSMGYEAQHTQRYPRKSNYPLFMVIQ